MLILLISFSYNRIEYNPHIDTMISNVDSAELVKWNREISGEDSIFYLGDSTLILTRFYFTYGMTKAEDYLYDYFESLGLETYRQIYWLIDWHYGKWNYDYLRWHGIYPGYYVVNDTSIYLTSTDSVLYYTPNGGNRWITVEEFPTIISGVSVPAPGTLYVYSQTGEFYFSDDGGNNFEERDSLLPSYIMNMHFLTGKKGWLLSGTGIVAITDDAAMNWDTVETGVLMSRDIYFTDSLNGWLCGYWGKIHHSTDGGYTWVAQTSPIYKNLHGIYFMNADTGWICGDDGTLLQTTDGGNNWEDISFSTANFREVYFKTFLEGWIGGTNGKLYYTLDGGYNWEEIQGATTTFNGIFDTGANVFFCGERDLLLYDNSEYVNRNFYLPNAVCNIIAVQPGIVHPDTTVIIGAHCDAVDIYGHSYTRAPGANDNGTGVNTVREVAKILSEYDFDYTIEYILFGAEEVGLTGSEYYADNAAQEGKPIRGLINLDCLGFDTLGNHDFRLYTDSTGGEDFAYLAVDIISLYSLPLNLTILDTSSDPMGCDAYPFWENGYLGILFCNDEWGPVNTIYDSIHIINPSMHYNMTKLAVAELAYMSELSSTGIPEDVYTPITLKLDSPIVNGSHLSFTISGPKNTPVKITLYDVTGRMVHRVFHGALHDRERFEVRKKFRTGVYFLRVDSDIGVASKKLVIFGG